MRYLWANNLTLSMKHRILFALIIIVMIGMSAMAQQLPRFASSSYDGWIYNNPGVVLSPTAIANGKVVLYVNSANLALTLTSPEFPCQDIDSINAVVTWYTAGFFDSSYDVARTALTMAIESSDDAPLDSITVTPVEASISTHTLSLTLAVPHGLNAAKLRFVSWDADVVSSGAIKRVILSAVTADEPDEPDVLPGDVNQNGQLDVEDVTMILNLLLKGSSGVENTTAADVDKDGEITIIDVTLLISKLLTGD